MSINPFSYFSRAVEAIGGAVSHAKGYFCSLVSSSTCDKITRFKTSFLGQKVFAATKENVAEFVGYYGGAMLLAPVGGAMGAALCRRVGACLSLALSTFSAAGVTKIALLNTTQPGIRRILICALTFSLISYLIHTLSFDQFAAWGASIGQTTGEFFMYVGAGILSAFAAIKSCKSEEVLWGDDIPRTYPFKTLLSMLVCALVEYAGYLPSNVALSGVLNLILGSLVYNALDLKDFHESAQQGLLLKGLLPAAMPWQQLLESEYFDPLYQAALDEGVSRCIQTLPIKAVVNQGFSRGIKVLKVKGMLREAHSAGLAAVPALATAISRKTIRRKLIVRHVAGPLAKPLQTIIHKQLTTLIDTYPIASELSKSTSEIQEIAAECSFRVLVRSINMYCQILSEHPEMLSSYKGSLEQLRLFVLEGLSCVSTDMCSFVQLCNDRVLTIEQADILKTQFEASINALHVPSAGIERAATKMADTICVMEPKILGFSFLTPEKKIETAKLLQAHIEWVVKIAPLTAPTIGYALTEEELRLFYKNASALFFAHYRSVLGSRFSGFLEPFFNHQISNSPLS